MAAFRLGVNYWPRRSAMAMWKQFDAAEIRDDLARIASWGLDYVRFFLLWEDFQPEPSRLDAVMRDRLIAFVDAAAAARLACMPTLFTGHMSGVNWLPEWTLDPSIGAGRFRTINARGIRAHGAGDFYAGALLDAQLRFARAAGTWLRGHEAVFCWDLGNEFSNLRRPRNPRAAADWSARLTEALFEASGFGSTGGLHGEDLSEDRAIRLGSISSPWICASMHGYAAYSAFARSAADAEAVVFLHDLARTLSGKPVQFTETGTPAAGASVAVGGLDEREASAFCSATLDGLQRHGALSAAWWCFGDYVPALAATPPFDLAPHELSFGIVRADGTEKPVADTLMRFAAERRTVVEAPPTLDIDEEAYYAGLPASLVRAYSAYTRG